jgi:hypothetical protein
VFEPATLIDTVLVLTYPLLWSVTLSLVAVLLMMITWHVKAVLVGLQRIMPRHSVFCAGLFLTMTIAIPLLGGPLPAVAAWSLLVLITIPHRRVIACAGGVVVALWGAMLPIRENAVRWFAQQGSDAVMEIARGRENLKFDQEGRLLALRQLSRQRPDDAAVQFSYAQALKQIGSYDDAKERMMVAAAHSADPSYASAEVAVIDLLRGDLDGAASSFAALYQQGFRDVRFLYNYSLLKFEFTDTEGSRKLFAEAQAADRELVSSFLNGEPQGSAHRGVVPMLLPWRTLTPWLISPVYSNERKEDVIAQQLFRGANPVVLMVLGFSVALMYFLARTQGSELVTRVAQGRYVHPRIVKILFRLIPGGAWVIAGRVVRGWALLTICIFALFPLVYWPHEANGFLELLPGLRPVYACGLGILTLILLLRGFHLVERRASVTPQNVTT